MRSTALLIPSVRCVRGLVEDITGTVHSSESFDEAAFDALGLDVLGRIELGARLATVCHVAAPIEVIEDGSATPSDLIAELINDQLDSPNQLTKEVESWRLPRHD